MWYSHNLCSHHVSLLVPFNNILWDCIAYHVYVTYMFTHWFYFGVYRIYIPLCLLISFFPLVCNAHMVIWCFEATVHHHFMGESLKKREHANTLKQQRENVKRENEKDISIFLLHFAFLIAFLVSYLLSISFLFFLSHRCWQNTSEWFLSWMCLGNCPFWWHFHAYWF